MRFLPGNTSTPSRRKRLVTVVLALLVTLIWAIIANYGLDVATWAVGGANPWVNPWLAKPIVLNVLVVWLAILLVLAITGRLWLTLGITGLITLSLAVIHLTKLRLRNDPLVPSDTAFLAQPDFLVEMVGKSRVVMAVVGMVFIVLMSWLVGRVVSRWLPHIATGMTSKPKWALRLGRLVVAGVSLALLLSAGNFNDPGNPWKAAYDATGLRWRTWDQRVNYLRNGFVAGVLYNTHVEAMKQPPGYTKANLEAIAAKYTAMAQEQNRGRKGSLDNVNVVTVLSESFSDPTWLKTVTWPQTPVPLLEKQMSKSLSGKLLTPGFGSGTANVEFEMLTGQSLSQFTPQLQLPYEQIVPHYDTYPSAVEWLKAHNHKAIAFHPFTFRMYKRPEVFKAFGFDELLDKSKMADPFRQDGGRFVSDAAAFGEVEQIIKSESQPVFMHLISMQNHMPYPNQYKDPLGPSSGLPPAYSKLAGQYGRGANLTDKALHDFLGSLKQLDEPTVVVFYGDHLPPQIYPSTLPQREGIRDSHQTPWLIWSNTEKFAHPEQPTTSPTQLLPLLFDATKTPEPPMYALLDALRAQLPAMDAGILIDANNNEVKRSALTPEQAAVLHDYRLVQYDMSIGKRYVADQMFANAN
ncbi:MAG: sulfatase-like hydrolase/transferase [Marmoricola sp.]